MAENTRRLPIGVQSFESLREGGYIYVDKTRYIYDLIHSSKQYFLSRPRRFGKSLFLSTLAAYWEGRQELFEGLAITELEKDNEEAWQPYPVFYFDFNGENYQGGTLLEEVLDKKVSEWEARYGCKEQGTLSGRFKNLLVTASEKTGKGCVVLVDEYDKPLLEVLENNELEEHNKAVFKGFFGTLKSYDKYLQFVFITGVTKFSKVSIFSDLNHLDDISLHQRYAGICGLTEAEVEETFAPEIEDMAQRQGLSHDNCLAELRKMYDGYHFHPQGEGIYNPFSLLKAFDEKELGAYWFSTGTPTFLVRRLKAMHFDVRQFTQKTLETNDRMLSDYRADNPNPLPLLYQTGYLTIVDYDQRARLYTLGFPNEEVKYGFLESLLPEYAPEAGSGNGKDIFALRRRILAGDTEGMKDILTALFASIPYTTNDAPFEHYFQSVLYMVFTLLGQFVQCEVRSSRGRADCIVETDDFVYIFEFKVDKPAQEALQQIEDKGYADPFASGSRQVFKIGVSFDSGQRNLAQWLVEV
ncbi:MAG: AAA family ATPase [Selenomonas ruminantium]|nr:AAA family ATPase [Selenomonas ruminantium]